MDDLAKAALARSAAMALDARRMKSILGLVAALAAILLVTAAYVYSIRPHANWFDSQWLFVVALPYNWTMLNLFGASHFSPDAPAQIIAALLFDAALAYLAGAAVEFAIRIAFRGLRTLIRPS